MTAVIILSVLSVPIVWLLIAPSKKNRVHVPSIFEVEDEPEQVPIYENFRRVQQTLSRKSKTIEDQIREIGLGKQELAIGNLLLAVGNKHLEVKSDIISLDEKALDTTKREIEALMRWNNAELKERSANLMLSEADLRAKQNELNKSLGLLELKEGEIKLKESGLELKGVQNEIAHRLNLLDIGDKRLELKGKEIDLGALLNKVKNETDLLSIFKKELDSQQREIGLDKREVLLERFHNKNLVELGEIALGKKEIELGKKELEHLYRLKAFQLETTMQKIKHMYTDLYLERKAYKNEQKEGMLKLYHQELKNLDQHIRQMYEVRMNWLRIEERENKVSYREDRLQLKDLYERTMNQLENLRLQKFENQLLIREREVEKKNSVLGFVGKSWLR